MSRYAFDFKILTNRFPFKWGGTNLAKLMQVVKEELEEFVEQLNTAFDAQTITHATGDQLDLWGKDLGVLRAAGEDDATYRARLLVAWRDLQETLVVTAYKNAITATTVSEPVCRQHYRFIPSCGYLTTVEQRSPFFTWPAQAYARRHVLTASFVLGNVNFIGNAGFEDGDWGGDDTQSDEEQYKGDYSGKLVSDGLKEVHSGKSNRIDIDPATYVYTVSAWIDMTAYTQGKFVLQAFCYDGDDLLLGTIDWFTGMAVTTGWEKKTHTFDPGEFPVNTAKIDFGFSWLQEDVDMPIGTAYVDNYKFEIAEAATEDWTQTELDTIASDLLSVKLATVNAWLTENSGLGYYKLLKEVTG